MKSLIRRNRLLWSLIITILLAISLPAAIFGAGEIYFRFQNTVNVTARAQAQQVFNVLQRSASEAVWTYNSESIEQLIDGIASDHAVQQVSVVDSFGATFAEFKRNDEAATHLFTLTGTIHYEDEEIGSVEMVYSIGSEYSAAKSEAIRLLSIFLAQATLSLLAVIWLLKRQVTNPINSMIGAAQGISKGDLDTPVTLYRNDELGALSNHIDQARVALKDLFQNLEDRVQERTAELSQVNGALETTIDQLKQAQAELVETEKLSALGSLVAGVSHELNTPLGNSLMMASTLVDTIETFSDQLTSGQIKRSELTHYLETINSSANIMQSNISAAADLVKSFKQVSVDRTSEHARQFELVEYLHEIEATVRHLFKHRPITLSVEGEPPISMFSYPGPLNQIVNNLINNALIHAFEESSEGNVVIRACIVDREQVEITITDDGCGIPEDNLSRVLEPFFTTKLGKGGSGLGMHIVHNIVTGVLQGSLRINSQEGQGTRVTLLLPTHLPGASE